MHLQRLLLIPGVVRLQVLYPVALFEVFLHK